MVKSGGSLPNWKNKNPKSPQILKERELEYTCDGGLEEATVRPLLATGGVGWEGFAKL